MVSHTNIEQRHYNRHPFYDLLFPGIFLLLKKSGQIIGRGIILDFSLNGFKFKTIFEFLENELIDFSIKVPEFSHQIFEFAGNVVWCKKIANESGFYLTGIEVNKKTISEWEKLYNQILLHVTKFEEPSDEKA